MSDQAEPEARRTPRVFLSFAREDTPVADGIREALAIEGLDVWTDARIEPGSSIAESISRAVRQADAVVVLLSRASERSSWVSAEVAAALAARSQDPRKLIVPIVVDDTADIPPFLRDVAALRLAKDPSQEQDQFAALAGLIQRRDDHPVARDPRTARELYSIQAEELLREELEWRARSSERFNVRVRMFGVVLTAAVALLTVILALVLGLKGQSAWAAAAAGAALATSVGTFAANRSERRAGHDRG